MRRSLIAMLLLVALVAVGKLGMPGGHASAAQTPSISTGETLPTFSTEQEWIVSDVLAAVNGIAAAAGTSQPQVAGVRTVQTGAAAFDVGSTGGDAVRVQINSHIWAPESYADYASRALAGPTRPRDSGPDASVRARLTDLASETLLGEAHRISALLSTNITSAGAHESAALIVAALALREASGALSDVRSELSRTAAHLTVARTLRGGSIGGLDGGIAAAVLTTLAGRQRDAMQMLADIDQRSTLEEDRVWTRALRLRVTGDWRVGPPDAAAPLLERAEFARALRTRRGDDAFMTYVESTDPRERLQWQRIAYAHGQNVEVGNTFGGTGIDREMAEARRAWSQLHTGADVPADLTAVLNERPAASPASATAIHVLDWGRMAAFHQRHLAQAMIFEGRHLANLGDDEATEALPAELQQFQGLRLYPIVARRVARTAEQYAAALEGARPVVGTMPHVVPAAAWNLLLEKPQFAKALAFPFADRWFSPYVPAGTLYDLASRSLRPGCRRPPSIEQARAWAAEAPYDYWTRWTAEWYPVAGQPALPDLKRALGSLLDYDQNAIFHLLEHVRSSPQEQILTARRLCRVSPSQCDALAVRLLRAGREPEAQQAYEAWIAGTRDRVAVSNELTWIVRYYQSHGNGDRAMALAMAAAATGSARGLETLAHALDRTGAYAEAQAIYERIADRYNYSRPLGTAYLRQGLRTGDKTLEARGMELLRQDLPDGMERLALHALDARPKDGLAFADFGPRPAATGLQERDVVVGVDEWRIRSVAHYWVATRLGHEDRMTLTVWRNGAYKQFKTTVPERWLGTALGDYVAPVGAR